MPPEKRGWSGCAARIGLARRRIPCAGAVGSTVRRVAGPCAGAVRDGETAFSRDASEAFGTAAESFFKGDAARYVRGKDIATVRIVPEDAGEGLTWNLFDLQMFAVLENKGEMSQ